MKFSGKMGLMKILKVTKKQGFGGNFVYIFIVDSNFLTKFCSSNPSFNENILTSLYLTSETSAHAQLCDYSFIPYCIQVSRYGVSWKLTLGILLVKRGQ